MSCCMKQSEKIWNTLSDFDLFAIKPILYFQGKDRKGTKFGFGLTLFFITIGITCFVYFGQDLFFLNNPTVVFSERFESSPEKFVLDPEKMPIAIEINNNIGNIFYTNSSHFKVKVSQMTISNINGKKTTTFENYPLETCRPDHFDKLNSQERAYFLNLKISNFFCLPKYLKNLTAQGTFDQNFF